MGCIFGLQDGHQDIQGYIKAASEVYRKIRNTCRYILGNIYDFDPNKDMVSYDEMNELDKWALMKLNGLIKKVNDAYEKYEFHLMFHAIHNFCVVDMSNFYLDIIKDRLYTSRADSKERRSAQTAMYEILEALVKCWLRYWRLPARKCGSLCSQKHQRP